MPDEDTSPQQPAQAQEPAQAPEQKLPPQPRLPDPGQPEFRSRQPWAIYTRDRDE